MNKKILIADDYNYERKFLQEMCKRVVPLYELEIYKSSEELEKRFGLGFEGVSLVILDQTMTPGKKGLELIRQYSGEAKEKGCKMILNTGDDELKEKAKRAGAFDCIIKPVFPNQLEKIISNALNS